MTKVHIHAPKGHYIGQVRLAGHQKWETVTVPCKSDTQAMSTAVFYMTKRHKRARVIFVAEWYDPVVVMECKR